MGGCMGSNQQKGQENVQNPEKQDKQINQDEISVQSDEDEDEFQDLVDKETLIKMKQNKKGHKSVSAEVFGKFNTKAEYIPRIIPKSEDQIERIQGKIMKSFMFQALNDKDRNIVISAFEEKQYNIGDTVIQQGDDGDVLYLIDQGELDCFKVFNESEGPKYLKTYQPGESFGELALLYNAPRAATIKAKTQSILFSLDRECFNNIVKDSSAKKREIYQKLLAKIELLSDMSNYERLQVADALQSTTYKQGDIVITQGEQGNKFYFVEVGQAHAVKDNKVVLEYKEGDYFGELALLKDQPRAATVTALTDLQLAVLDRDSFKRLLGPLEKLLERNEAKYKQHIQ